MGNFFDAISDPEMRLKIQPSRPKVFNEAVKVAVELEAFDKAERQRQGNKYVRGTACTSASTETPSEHSVIQPILERLDKLLKSYETKKSSPDSATGGSNPKFRCYKCKKPGHFQRDCPLIKKSPPEGNKSAGEDTNAKRVGRFCDKSSTRKKGRKAKRSASARFVEAGMYLPVQINGIETNMLVDSGAAASLISVEVYEMMDKGNKLSLKPVQGEMVAVNGMNLKTLGYCD